MFLGVGEHLGDDVIDADFDRLWQPSVDPDVQFHRDNGASPKRAQRRVQASLRQDRRVDAMGDLPQVVDHAHQLSGRVRHPGTRVTSFGG